MRRCGSGMWGPASLGRQWAVFFECGCFGSASLGRASSALSVSCFQSHIHVVENRVTWPTRRKRRTASLFKHRFRNLRYVEERARACSSCACTLFSAACHTKVIAWTAFLRVAPHRAARDRSHACVQPRPNMLSATWAEVENRCGRRIADYVLDQYLG